MSHDSADIPNSWMQASRTYGVGRQEFGNPIKTDLKNSETQTAPTKNVLLEYPQVFSRAV
jgi:hypothetical protein